ncbi:MAG: TlyA family RNA methyltransferase [Chloroflexota bacterium]|nr:TlyA family RNA methyltransferase [Chloroflexota bacterium]
MAGKMRLDLLVVERGLAPTRERAQALILQGNVRVSGERHSKAGEAVAVDAPIELAESGLPYVSRGGLKLQKAVDLFQIDPTGLICLDVGASTGGFTDCLLQGGAGRVYAVDVGYGQLDWKLRNDPRVVILEKTNIRYLQELPEKPQLAAIDVSFISLSKVLEPVLHLVDGAVELAIIVLVKPQFEVGPGKAPKGVVRNPAVHRQVLAEAVAHARGLGLAARGITASPVTGPAGNREFLLWLSNVGPDLVDEEAIERCAAH